MAGPPPGTAQGVCGQTNYNRCVLSKHPVSCPAQTQLESVQRQSDVLSAQPPGLPVLCVRTCTPLRLPPSSCASSRTCITTSTPSLDIAASICGARRWQGMHTRCSTPWRCMWWNVGVFHSSIRRPKGSNAGFTRLGTPAVAWLTSTQSAPAARAFRKAETVLGGACVVSPPCAHTMGGRICVRS